jgi:outer membrane protein OmpA-like peptidoglycan-associated protein
MKKHLVYAFLFVALYANAQETKDTTSKPAAIGFKVGVLDFAKTNHTDGLTTVAPYVGIQFLKGLAPHWDFVTNLNATALKYPYYTSSKITPATTNGLYMASDLNLHYKFGTDSKKVVPFVSAGFGVGTDRFSLYSAYFPVGGGLQIKANHGSFLLLSVTHNAEKEWYALTKKHTSFGVSYTIPLKGKPKKAIELPQAPIKADADNDGVDDKDDLCPNQSGIAKYKGCPIPDSDKDGVNDEEDKCPNQSGVAKYKGCPIPDTDKDGVNDEEDKCPTVSGLSRYQGCPIPDTDKDGVNDEEDKCPTIAGISANHGCADLQPLLDKATEKIKFASGSIQLTKKQLAPLNDVLQLMKENTSISITVNGHTDNVGARKLNDKLSLRRATVIQKYLVKKGVEANRLSSIGYADTKPIADNKTAKGRAANRRVDMTVKY